MDKQLISDFFTQLASKDLLQRKYTANWRNSFQDNELEEFCKLIEFFIEKENKTMEEIVNGYMFLNEMVREEQYYFVKNGHYRYSKLSEVDNAVYHNKEYMSKYMLGVAVSDYIWTQHVKMLRYFEYAFLPMVGGDYLEIGPGYGQYMIRALRSNRFKTLLGCDLSAESVRGCKSFLQYQGYQSDKSNCDIMNMDFNDFDADKKFDTIVMGEVLEHVENPLQLLENIRFHLAEGGKAYITTVINAPTLDHIYLFKTIDEVKQLILDSGFDIVDYEAYAAGDVPIEKAEKKNRSIDIALIIKSR